MRKSEGGSEGETETEKKMVEEEGRKEEKGKMGERK